MEVEVEASTGADTGEDLLKKLARTAVHLFYQPKDLLIVDLIIKEERKLKTLVMVNNVVHLS